MTGEPACETPPVADAPRDRWRTLSGAVWSAHVEVQRSVHWLSQQPWRDPEQQIDEATAVRGTAAAVRHRVHALHATLRRACQMPDKPDWVWTAARGAKTIHDAKWPTALDTSNKVAVAWANAVVDGLSLLRAAVLEAADHGDEAARAAVEGAMAERVVEAIRQIGEERKLQDAPLAS